MMAVEWIWEIPIVYQANCMVIKMKNFSLHILHLASAFICTSESHLFKLQVSYTTNDKILLKEQLAAVEKNYNIQRKFL